MPFDNFLFAVAFSIDCERHMCPTRGTATVGSRSPWNERRSCHAQIPAKAGNATKAARKKNLLVKPPSSLVNVVVCVGPVNHSEGLKNVNVVVHD